MWSFFCYRRYNYLNDSWKVALNSVSRVSRYISEDKMENVVKIALHPNFNPGFLYLNDIAVMTLENPVSSLMAKQHHGKQHSLIDWPKFPISHGSWKQDCRTLEGVVAVSRIVACPADHGLVPQRMSWWGGHYSEHLISFLLLLYQIPSWYPLYILP